jgi:hypothetical protein
MFEIIERSLRMLGRKLGLPQYRNLEAMPTTLVVFFSLSVLPGSYWTWVVVQHTTELLPLIDQHGWLHLNLIPIAAMLLAAAIMAFFFGSMARRCGEILYQRLGL